MPSITRERNIGIPGSKLLAFNGQRKGILGLTAVAAAGQAATRVPAAFSAALAAVGDLGRAMATRGRARGAGGEGVIAGVLLERVLDLHALGEQAATVVAGEDGNRMRLPDTVPGVRFRQPGDGDALAAISQRKISFISKS